jgi:hypothetical protein
MAAFSFNGDSSFEANLVAFLQYMTAEDAELGAILAAEISRLKGVVESGRRSARTDFNAAVKLSLDNLLTPLEEGGSK